MEHNNSKEGKLAKMANRDLPPKYYQRTCCFGLKIPLYYAALILTFWSFFASLGVGISQITTIGVSIAWIAPAIWNLIFCVLSGIGAYGLVNGRDVRNDQSDNFIRFFSLAYWFDLLFQLIWIVYTLVVVVAVVGMKYGMAYLISSLITGTILCAFHFYFCVILWSFWTSIRDNKQVSFMKLHDHLMANAEATV